MKPHRDFPFQLVVEGYSDQRFFQGLQRHIGLEGKFDVKYPGMDGKHPGKDGALKRFEFLLKEAVEPSRFKAIGLCVDADFTSAKGGFEATNVLIKNVLKDADFRMVDADRRLYRHDPSKCLASYWIAPSHQEDGYLESLLLNAFTPNGKSWLTTKVQPFIESLNPPLFNPNNTDRANLYVYLGIQKKPDKSLATLLDDGHIDLTMANLASLRTWLLNLFELPQ